MTILICILLVVLIAVESAQFYYNFYTIRHSFSVYKKMLSDFEAQNAQLRKENMRLNDMLDDVTSDKFDAFAFVLTSNGMQLLPKDWREKLK